MKKLNKLLRGYYNILKEADDSNPAANAAPTAGPVDQGGVVPNQAETPPPAPVIEPPLKPMSPGEVKILDILIRSFLFSPELFNKYPNKKIQVQKEIDNIKESSLLPMSKVLMKVEALLNMVPSLATPKIHHNGNVQTENVLFKNSKTLLFLRRYQSIIEKSADATEPQADDKMSSTQASKSAPVNKAKLDINLNNMWESYRELICNALEYKPDTDQVTELEEVIADMGDTDPARVKKAIQTLLMTKQSTTGLEGLLANT
jgi:hypothetical protein